VPQRACAEITERVTIAAPSLLAIIGCGALTAAEIVGETAQVHRFRSKDAVALLNGTAPLPEWSSNMQRHRLSRTGNRQLSAALHLIATTQAPITDPRANSSLDANINDDGGGIEALRILKRRLSDAVYRAMLTDESQSTLAAASQQKSYRQSPRKSGATSGRALYEVRGAEVIFSEGIPIPIFAAAQRNLARGE
jgi:transposase